MGSSVLSLSWALWTGHPPGWGGQEGLALRPLPLGQDTLWVPWRNFYLKMYRSSMFPRRELLLGLMKR